MPLIDRTYFFGSILLVVNGNEDAIDQSIATYEPMYLQAVLGPSLYAAFIQGLATPVGVYFSNQFTDQFFKGTIADRWKWIRDGHSFSYGGRLYVWPGMQNVAKQSPVANYVYWNYIQGRNPAPSQTGSFTTPVLENATLVSPYKPMMRAWNQMHDWNHILLLMVTSLTDTAGAPLYPEFVRSELCSKDSVDVYHIQSLF